MANTHDEDEGCDCPCGCTQDGECTDDYCDGDCGLCHCWMIGCECAEGE